MGIDGGASTIVQMDADWSHDPAHLGDLPEPIFSEAADLVIGSRYVRGGCVKGWGLARRFISRGGSAFARIVLGRRAHDLTGGFTAWRASRAGARMTEIPIVFRDRRAGRSKLSRRIIVEALIVVLRLRFDEVRARLRRR